HRIPTQPIPRSQRTKARRIPHHRPLTADLPISGTAISGCPPTTCAGLRTSNYSLLRSPRLPSQRELWPNRLPRPLFPWPRNKPILLPNPRHTLRHLLPVFIRRIPIFGVPLLILVRQFRKFLAYKRQKLFRRRRHQ